MSNELTNSRPAPFFKKLNEGVGCRDLSEAEYFRRSAGQAIEKLSEIYRSEVVLTQYSFMGGRWTDCYESADWIATDENKVRKLIVLPEIEGIHDEDY